MARGTSSMTSPAAPQESRREPQVLHEPSIRFVLELPRHAQERRRIRRHGQACLRRERRDPPPVALDRRRPSGYRARRGRAERHDQLRAHESELALEPLLAGLDFPLGGLLVDTPLAARLVLEMLYGVRDVGL